MIFLGMMNSWNRACFRSGFFVSVILSVMDKSAYYFLSCLVVVSPHTTIGAATWIGIVFLVLAVVYVVIESRQHMTGIERDMRK